jgi:uncharacterized protein YggE
MKKIAAIAGLAAGALVIAALVGVGLPESAHGDAGITRTITVNGDGTVKAKPDRAGFSFGVDSRAATAQAASAENARAMRTLIAALKAAGVAEKDIQTQQVSVWPQTDGDNKITGYTASGSVSAETAIADAGEIVDAATNAGANNVSGPSLTLADSDAQQAQALKSAVADARRKAEALADASNANLGQVVKVVEGGSAEPVPMYERAAMAKDAAAPIEPGTVDTTASVTVTFQMT